MEEIEDEEPLRRNEALPLAKGVPILELADPQSANVASAGQSPSGTPLATSSKPTLSEESEMEMIGSTDVGREEEMIRSATHSSSSHRDFSPTLENESVTASLALRSARQAAYGDVAPERFFTRVGRSIELFKESIDAAVQRYHGAYDPYSSSQEDPLLPYRAIHGEIPDMDPASSLALRDAVMRYEYPSRNFEWSRLSDLVEGVVQLDAAKVTLMPTADPETEERYYSLNLASLSLVGHAVVAMQQILQALTIFLRRDPATSFYLDPGYGFLYMLEICSSQKELRFALTTLQMCLARADVHVRSYFRGIRETLTNEQFSEQISSVDSTISEVRRDFGGQHPRKELFRLLNRDDYGQRASLIDDAARRHALSLLAEEPRLQYYKRREQVGASGEQRAETLASANAASRALPAPAGVRFAPATPISAGRRSVISALPGVGNIPNTETGLVRKSWSLPSGASVNGGPSVMREALNVGIATAPQSTGNPIPAVGPALSTNAWTSYHFQAGPTTTTTTVPQQTVVAVPGGTGSSGPPGGVPPGWTGRIPARRNGGGRNGGNGDGPGGDGEPGNGFGGGGGGFGGGNGGPGGPEPAAPGLDPASASDQWQINPKLNISVVPAWDGKGESVIPYVITMSYLAALSPKMASGIAQMAPYKFSGRAMRWWNNLSLVLRSHYSSSWSHLLDAIRRHFLTMKWLMDRTQEFEEMRFRQKGLESEDPLDFFQRRIESHSFIYNDAGDGPQAVARILRTQPAEWAKDVNETSCPDVDALQNYAEHNRASLIAAWLLANQVDALMVNGTGSRTNGFHRRRRALAADRVAGAAESDSEAEELVDEGSKQAMAADQRRMGGRAPNESKPPWPKGKTINGYEFKR
ncbi:hypothetical protein B0H13DRAFT_2346314 [Mycena leptocephala]|nr:hypothetical protein B0H13DRAFT_2346314 [Mycena leptocephala]